MQPTFYYTSSVFFPQFWNSVPHDILVCSIQHSPLALACSSRLKERRGSCVQASIQPRLHPYSSVSLEWVAGDFDAGIDLLPQLLKQEINTWQFLVPNQFAFKESMREPHRKWWWWDQQKHKRVSDVYVKGSKYFWAMSKCHHPFPELHLWG